MDLKLSGRKVLITGASQGIREGVAQVFAAEGCELVLVARNVEKLTAVADQLRSEFHATVDGQANDGRVRLKRRIRSRARCRRVGRNSLYSDERSERLSGAGVKV